MTDVVSAVLLTKQYRGMTRPALADFNCTLTQGEIVGLLGPNGAGKTTLVKLMCGITTATSGTVQVCGGDPVAHAAVKNRLAVVHQSAPVDQMLSAIDNIKIAAAFRGLKWRGVRARVDELLAQFDLDTVADQLAFTLSGGQRRRLQLVRALLTVPQLLILDEPSAGLDVQGRRQMWDLISKLNVEHGTSIIWTSHYIEEIERNCGRILIIDQGKLVRDDPPANLIAEFGHRSVVVHLPDPDDYNQLSALLPKRDVTPFGTDRLHITGASAEQYLSVIMDAVQAASGRQASIEFRTASLEDAYISLVVRDAEGES